MRLSREEKIILIIVGILMIVLLVTDAFAEVCFNEEDATKILLEVERGKLCCSAVAEYKNLVDELDAKVALCQTRVEEIGLTITDLQDLMKEKDKVCEEALDDCGPSFFENVFKVLGGVAIGIIIGILI